MELKIQRAWRGAPRRTLASGGRAKRDSVGGYGGMMTIGESAERQEIEKEEEEEEKKGKGGRRRRNVQRGWV